MKTCLICTATNDDAALRAPCSLIGLCHSLHLETRVIPPGPPPPSPPTTPTAPPQPEPSKKHKRANPETRLRGWRGLEELGQGKGASDVAQEERKGAPEADVGEGASCVIINKALKKKKSVHIKACRGYAIIHESNALWPNVS